MNGSRRIVAGAVMPVVVAVALAGTARAGSPQVPGPVRAGEAASRDTGVPGHASRAGSYWQALSGKEKDAYVRTFLSGALSAQVKEIAVSAHRNAGSAEVQTEVQTEVWDRIVDSLRASHAVRFPFAATVYVAQLDDFYWWQDHMAVPVDDALLRINAQMEAQQSRP
jgi:hypothetical protein